MMKDDTEGLVVVNRKRSADDEIRIPKRGYPGPTKDTGGGNTAGIKRKSSEDNAEDIKTKMETEAMLDLSKVSDSYLVNLPSNLLSHLGCFLSVNEMTALAMTRKMMYSARSEYCYPHHKSNDDLFRLVLEETLPIEHDFKSVLEPFRFLFQSSKYGILQVDFAVVHPPKGGYQRGGPTLRHFYARRKKESWEKVAVRINIQKQFPKEACDGSSRLTTPKVIFRLDQSLPGCCFHFESKIIVGWEAGSLGYLMQRCVTRVTELQTRRGNKTDDGLVLSRPSTDDILTKFQATIRENALRFVKRKDNN